MRFKRPVLRLALDEGVPDEVGRVLKTAGHKVIYLNKTIPRGSPDRFVCAFAQINESILVALDGDMREIARAHQVSKGQFKSLSLIKLSCREPRAAARVQAALSLIEHEWHISSAEEGRRLFVEIGDSLVKTNR